MSKYTELQRLQAIWWKNWTATLPPEAKVPAPYVGKDGHPGQHPHKFCLPPEHAALSLLPEVRDRALALFAELEIPWHASVAGGPSNHLLSSQVQCANALTQMVDDPSRLMAALGEELSIAEVLQIEPGRFLTFEYIGPTDFFGEARGGIRTRGAYCTSVDAAFLHRTTDGLVELVLLEWKYTERYEPRTDQKRDAERARRYRAALSASDSPIDGAWLPFERMLDEPLYQLVRQQLLAHELEKAHAHGADRVRVVQILPGCNTAYEASLRRPEHLAVGKTVTEIWNKLLRQQDRFVSLSPQLFADSAITSTEYVARYSERLVRDAGDLLVAFEVEELDGVEAELEFPGWLDFTAEGLELVIGGRGTILPWPFTLHELADLLEELTADDG